MHQDMHDYNLDGDEPFHLGVREDGDTPGVDTPGTDPRADDGACPGPHGTTVGVIHSEANPVAQCQLMAWAILAMADDFRPHSIGEAIKRADQLRDMIRSLMSPLLPANYND